MQDRYVGDIGDYAKYSLLRALSRGRKLAVSWYLFPDEDNGDGGTRRVSPPTRQVARARSADIRRTSQNHGRFFHMEQDRSVAAIEQSGYCGMRRHSGAA